MEERELKLMILKCALKLAGITIPAIGYTEAIWDPLLTRFWEKHEEVVPTPGSVLKKLQHKKRVQIIAAVEDLLKDGKVLENLESAVCTPVEKLTQQIIKNTCVINDHEEALESEISDALRNYLEKLQKWAVSSNTILQSSLQSLADKQNKTDDKVKDLEREVTNVVPQLDALNQRVEKLEKPVDNHPSIESEQSEALTLTAEKYEQYIQGYIHCSRRGDPLEVLFRDTVKDYDDAYVGSDSLLHEVDDFLKRSWRKALLQKIEEDSPEYSLVEDLLHKHSNTTDDATIISLTIKLKDVRNNSEYNRDRITKIIKYLETPIFENCILLSGQYGSGKTRFVMELAKCSLEGEGIYPSIEKSWCLYVNCQKAKSIVEQIVAEFQTLFQSQNSRIEDYMDVYSTEKPLIILLDDVHEFLQQGKSFEDIYSLIKTHSRSYIKWIIVNQGDYGLRTDLLRTAILRTYSYPFRSELKKYQCNNWFQLDDWNHDCKIVSSLIERAPTIDRSLWRWEESVSSEVFYNPLFSKVLVLYHALYPEKSIFFRNNLFYPSFCLIYFDVLSRQSESVIDASIPLASHFLSSSSLFLKKTEDLENLTQEMCNDLIDHGLLIKKNNKYAHYDTYEGIPNVVWFEKIAIAAKEQWVNPNNVLNVDKIKQQEKMQDATFLNNVISMVVLMLAEEATMQGDYTITTQLWETLLDSGLEQPVFEAGFKLASNLRNNLIKAILERENILHDYFAVFLDLCSLGDIGPNILYKIIDTSLKNHQDAVEENIHLFIYMLQRNYSKFTYNKVLEVFSKLNAIKTITSDGEVLQLLGRDLAEAIVGKAKNSNEMDSIIRNVLIAIERDRQIEKIDGPFPLNLCDYFSQQFGNAVISRYPLSAYDKFKRVKWYTFQGNIEWNQSRRNISLTLSLAQFYREYSDDEYAEWYENTVEKLSKSEIFGCKKMALYLIMHTGLKEHDYAIDPDGKLWKIAGTLFFHKYLQKLCKSGTLKVFYRKNFPYFFPKTKQRTYNDNTQSLTS